MGLFTQKRRFRVSPGFGSPKGARKENGTNFLRSGVPGKGGMGLKCQRTGLGGILRRNPLLGGAGKDFPVLNPWNCPLKHPEDGI